MFMILAVMLIIVVIGLLGWPSSMYLFSLTSRRFPLTLWRQALMASSFAGAATICVTVWLVGMRSGVRALESMRR